MKILYLLWFVNLWIVAMGGSFYIARYFLTTFPAAERLFVKFYNITQLKEEDKITSFSDIDFD